MPITQHPTSDTERLEALRQAKNRLDAVAPEEVVLTPATVSQLNSLLPQWDQEIRERDVAEGAQSQAAGDVQLAGASLRMLISHFLQAFNNAVTRGEFAPAERARFQLPPSQESLPVLTSEADLVTWGTRLKTGEAARSADGLAAVTMPPIAAVEAKLTAFETARAARDAAVDEKNKESDDVIALRDSVDTFLREDLWYEVQAAYRKDDPATARRKSRLWGVQYRFRSGEEPEPGEDAITSTGSPGETAPS